MINPDQVAGAYASAKIFVHSSKTEVHPMCIVEALVTGLPIVALYDEALSSMIIDGYNGYLVANEKEFVDRANHLLANSKKAKEFGVNSSVLAHTKYGAENFAKSHLEIYRNVIGKYQGRKRKEVASREFFSGRMRAAFVSLAVFVAMTGSISLVYKYKYPGNEKFATSSIPSFVM